MKFLKKASLAASIAAVSFAANAELVAMDEVAMSAATGQAGIDIDITLTSTEAVKVGQILYTDTAVGGDGDGGQLAISNLKLGSADGSAITLTNALDIKADGSLVIDSSTTNLQGLWLQLDGVETRTSTGVAAANLVGATSLYMNVKGGTATLAQSGTATTLTTAGGSVEILSGVDVDNADADNDPATGTLENSSTTLLNGAIGLSGIRAYGTGGLGTGITTDATLTFDTNGVAITGLNLSGTIDVANVTLGADSIGSLAISNIVLNGASIQISGH